VRLSEVAESEAINATMLSRVIAGLVERGLLQRSSDVGDRRAAWVRATRAGHRAAERIRRARNDALNQAMGALSDEQRRTIEQALPALEALAEGLKERRP
jgi:DNA-binding MarR family transcriptional regulator